MINLNKVSALIDDLQFIPEYGEPGYSLNGQDGILLANWNNVDSQLADVLEEHFNLEWSDEWIGINGKAYRTQPDCYLWKPSYICHNGELLTAEDLQYDAELICEIFADDYNTAITFDIDLARLGFDMVDTGYENGWYEGQNANPEYIMQNAKRENPDQVYVFTLDKTGQFDMGFSIWAYTPE